MRGIWNREMLLGEVQVNYLLSTGFPQSGHWPCWPRGVWVQPEPKGLTNRSPSSRQMDTELWSGDVGSRYSSSARCLSLSCFICRMDSRSLSPGSHVPGALPPLTCALGEVPQVKDVVELLVVVLFNVGGLFWGVLQLHGDLFQVFIQLEDEGSS